LDVGGYVGIYYIYYDGVSETVPNNLRGRGMGILVYYCYGFEYLNEYGV